MLKTFLFFVWKLFFFLAKLYFNWRNIFLLGRNFGSFWQNFFLGAETFFTHLLNYIIGYTQNVTYKNINYQLNDLWIMYFIIEDFCLLVRVECKHIIPYFLLLCFSSNWFSGDLFTNGWTDILKWYTAILIKNGKICL